MNNDLISRNALKEAMQTEITNVPQPDTDADYYVGVKQGLKLAETMIDNAPADNEMEKPFITECRDTAIKENLPLYFVYYEETGILEVYVTETKELFEKRRCSKHLPDYKFKDAVIKYLDWYSGWKGGFENNE